MSGRKGRIFLFINGYQEIDAASSIASSDTKAAISTILAQTARIGRARSPTNHSALLAFGALAIRALGALLEPIGTFGQIGAFLSLDLLFFLCGALLQSAGRFTSLFRGCLFYSHVDLLL
jgi:hypothetical protein